MLRMWLINRKIVQSEILLNQRRVDLNKPSFRVRSRSISLTIQKSSQPHETIFHKKLDIELFFILVENFSGHSLLWKMDEGTTLDTGLHSGDFSDQWDVPMDSGYQDLLESARKFYQQ